MIVFTGGAEAQALVEHFRAVLALVVRHGQPAVPTPHALLAYFLDREPPIALALVLGADIQPPEVTVEERVLVSWSERGHYEADQLVVVVDQPRPGNVWHRVGVCKGPGDRGDEVFLIGSQLQLAGSPDV